MKLKEVKMSIDEYNQLKALLIKARDDALKKSQLKWTDIFGGIVFKAIKKGLTGKYWKQVADNLDYQINTLEKRKRVENNNVYIFENLLRVVKNSVESTLKDIEADKDIFDKIYSVAKGLVDTLRGIVNFIVKILQSIVEAAAETAKAIPTGLKLLPFIIIAGLGVLGYTVYRITKSPETRELLKTYLMLRGR
ncbi:MAG: hypothetical protein ABIK75_05590 [candidate division WOR-3 bacterium]